MANKEKKVLLSLKDVDVKFNVRGRILSAIRNVSLDIYENESIAIVGESGSGKSVLTKTFAGMLDSNGFISHGTIRLYDDELADTHVRLGKVNLFLIETVFKVLNHHSQYERGAKEYLEIAKIKANIKAAQSLNAEEQEKFNAEIKEFDDDIIDGRNYLATLDPHIDADEIVKTKAEIEQAEAGKAAKVAEMENIIKQRKEAYKNNKELQAANKAKIAELKAIRDKKIKGEDLPETGHKYKLTDEVKERNILIAKEVVLSIGRYPVKDKIKFLFVLAHAFSKAMKQGTDLKNKEILNKIFETVVFRVDYQHTTKEEDGTEVLNGYAQIDCAKVKYTKDWQQIRGRRIATVFQDPMTSLNPVITIGKQIVTVILKHQKCSYAEAKERALEMMANVGIPEPKKRFNDYPFEYSGGMRQRIVIAIALSCQPKILICDEPTTALDVTIQAQIIRLIKDLQHKLGFTTVYITHDLGVVANVAERVAVLYGGQIVEIGTVEEIFYEPKHPYTWALLSSLPQLSERGTELFSIPGTPPSLYNKIIGDAFAPRSKYAMAIDLVKEPPMFKISETHYAKTWLLDPRSPKTEAPKNIQNLHEKMLKTHVDFE